MKLYTFFQQMFGFTRNEITVILFLSVSFLVGLVIRWHNSPGKDAESQQERFDYSQPDSEFAARSRQLEQLVAAPQPTVAKTSQSRSKTAATLAPGSVNINKASKDLLMQLPGIGEQYAERIIIYRDDHGPFRTIDDLLNVKGIGKKTLEKIGPYISVK